ncbi:hypothetical protein MTQ10_08470 [Streptomyces sp. XM83C]|jgi:hypothetical protein|uniref:Uncharacterized protein n=1 Tax=Streptomyces thermocoprophilus TaxID=78356 RepID=A0ABV5VLI3_9ACTN|nr:hypothetical protein [Streptomyces sp. XM83C]MCK1819642.1 hypothetical protein [Streptomyces sp. XM83C]
MYLIHVRLKGPDTTASRPDLATIITSCAGKADGLEHVAVHPGPEGDVTLGLFLLADRLATAERSAARLTERAVADHPALRGFRVLTAEAVLVPGPWWDS